MKLILFLLFALFPLGALSQESDTQLAQVMSHVRQTHPDILSSRLDLKSTQELHTQAVAGWHPRLDGSASIYASHIENSNFGRADGTTTKDLLLSLEQPLYRGGRTEAETARANALIASAYARASRIEQDTLLRAASVYMEVIRSRQQYALSLENETFLSDELTATQEKMAAGLLTKTDIEQAQARYSRGRAQTASALSALETAHARYAEITQLPPARTLIYPRGPGNIPASLEQALSGLRENNPDMIAARFQAEAARHSVDAARSSLYPQLSAFASFNKQYDPQPGIVDNTQNGTIGLRASMLFYDGGVIRSQTRQAEYAAQQRDLDIESAERELTATIISGWRQWQAAAAERVQREDEIAAAQSTLDGIKEEARLGERSVTDILNASYDLLIARSALIDARRNEMMAQYGLAATLGILGQE